MKVIDIANNIDKSERNEDWVSIESLADEFGIRGNFAEQDKLKSYWVGYWYCTDSWVGYKIYFLNDEPVCFSSRLGRKCDNDIEWFNKELAIKTRDYIISLLTYDEEEMNISYCDINEDVGDGYRIYYNTQVLDWSKATLDNEPVKFIELVENDKDWIRSNKDVKILLNNEEKVVNIEDLIFRFNLKEPQ